MTRRLAFLAILLSVAVCQAAEGDHPNILWITSEDHGPEMGCYGDKFATTPHVDALAEKGMLFKLAWSCAPVCAPARTTIITGMYPPSIGGQHMRSMVSLPKEVRFYPTFLREQGYYCTNNSKQDYNVRAAATGWDVSSRAAHYRDRKAGQPFFAIFNSTISHESKIRVRPHDKVHDPAKVRVPAYHPDNAETRQDWAQYYDVVTRADALAGKILAELDQDGLSENTIVFYYGDHGSGMSRSKRWTYNSGLAVPMVVYFPPKWKKLAPKEYQSGGKSDRLVNFVDLAPTLLSLSGVKPPKWMQGHAFAGKHQQPPPKYMFGFRDRMDERYDFIRTVTDGRFQYMRNYNPHFIYGQHVAYNFVTPSTAAWKRDRDAGKLNDAQSHFWKLKPAEELYDLKSDPDQVHNLADSPEHQEKLAELRKAQQDWCRRIRDLGFLPEGEIHSRSVGSTPREMGLDNEKYPFDRVFAAAEIATTRDAADLPALKKNLKDSDSAVRYWGAIGILNRGAKAVRDSVKELDAALNDESPYVRVAAGYALGKHGDEAGQRRGVDCLAEIAPWTPETEVFVSMAALNAIDKLDAKAARVLDALKTLPISGGRSPDGRYNGYVRGLKTKTLADLGVSSKREPKPKRKKPTRKKQPKK
ncbi:MAG: sulfatase-like hydrolase/transferase [Planctomycetales bacterium]